MTDVTGADGITRRTVYDDLMDGTARSRVLREEVQPAGAAAFSAQKTVSVIHSPYETGGIVGVVGFRLRHL